MPIHDWTRVTAGIWHAFHVSWIAEIQLSLNDGILPPDYYALAEQITGPLGPDVLTLQLPQISPNGSVASSSGIGGVAVSAPPPPMRVKAEFDMDDYVVKRRTIVIRHTSGDRIIALVEI